LLPLLLLAGEAVRFRPSAAGRLTYLASVIGGYAALLVSIHYHHTLWTLAIALALSLFHATEYLAVVTWSVRLRQGKGGQGVLAYLAPRWGLTLLLFIFVLAASGYLLDTRYHNLWAVATISVSYLHYAYDGLIWKARRPAARPAQ
jgi:hypothetical protein